jgi:hypothetical protein
MRQRSRNKIRAFLARALEEVADYPEAFSLVGTLAYVEAYLHLAAGRPDTGLHRAFAGAMDALVSSRNDKAMTLLALGGAGEASGDYAGAITTDHARTLLMDALCGLTNNRSLACYANVLEYSRCYLVLLNNDAYDEQLVAGFDKALAGLRAFSTISLAGRSRLLKSPCLH